MVLKFGMWFNITKKIRFGVRTKLGNPERHVRQKNPTSVDGEQRRSIVRRPGSKEQSQQNLYSAVSSWNNAQDPSG
jgi:hypothetical protein